MNYNIRPDSFGKIRRFNLLLGLGYFAQGIFMLAAALVINDIKIIKPLLYSSYMNWNTGNSSNGWQGFLENTLEVVKEVPIALLISIVLLISGVIYFALVNYKISSSYNSDLQTGLNKFRWIDYSITTSITLMFVAMLFGINDITSLVFLIFIAFSSNIMFMVMEILKKLDGGTRWFFFIMGTIIQGGALLMIFLYQKNNGAPEVITSMMTGFLIAQIAFFVLTLLITVLKQLDVWKFKDGMFVERAYSLTAFLYKSAFTWMFFIGALSGSIIWATNVFA
jgi:hypothetical protein